MIGKPNLAVGAILFATLSWGALAAPPASINLHGQLVDADGAAVTGSRAYQVNFFDAETGGNSLGSAITGTVAVSDSGLFNLAVMPPAAILSASEVWYTLGVDTDSPADNDASDDIFPTRIRVYSVPFALQAQEVVAVDASRVGNGSVDNTELAALDGITGNVQQQIDAIDTSGVAQNTTDIMTNTANIMTNATNIAANTTAIAGKANTADVYAKSAADSRFVDAAGDNMSGALGVNAITEATADAGITAEGLTLKDSYLGLPQITAPANTANKLYNVSGNLFFGGMQLGLTSLNKDGINDAGTLNFDWLDSEVADNLTIQGGSVNVDSFSAFDDLTAESKIGTGATQVAAGNHGHTLSALSGSVTDGQVPDALTIQGGSVNNDSFSALSDLNAESAIGTGAMQVAAGNHDHTLSALSGSVTDAQVPDTITIRGVSAADDTTSAPSLAYQNDPNTGIHRPGADQLAMVAGGSARLSVDTAEVNILGNILEMGASTAPGVTTNKLYNTGGNLFWNGTQLNAGGGADKDSLNWCTEFLSTAYNNEVMFAQKMPAAGTITGFQAWCFSGDGGFTVDLLKNGVTVLSSPLAFALNSLEEGALSVTTFSAGDILSLRFANGSSDLYSASVTILVEY